MATNTATFDAAIMRWVSPARAKGGARYYLDGILVEPHPQKGVYLVATNGHFMSVAYDDTGSATGPMIINPTAAAVKISSKTQGSRSEKVASKVVITGDRLTMMNLKDQELYVQPGKCLIEAKYPDWRNILKDIDKLVPGGDAFVRTDYIGKIGSEIVEQWGHHRDGVRIMRREGDDPRHAAQFIHFGSIPMVGVIMPMREGAHEPFGWFL